MTISLLIPIYGVEKYIERCAISLFEQTQKENIEYIFVNDCTPDKSLEILNKTIEKYPFRKSQIKIINHKRNRGLAAARQTALDSSRGNYLLTVDADDWIEPQTCELLMNHVNNHRCDILFFDYFIDYKHKNFIIKQNPATTGDDCLKLLLKGDIHGGSCLKLIRRNLYIENDIQYIEGLNMLEDISVMFRLLYFAKKTDKINIPLYHYYQGNINSYTATISDNSKKNMLQLLDVMDVFFAKNETSSELKEYLNLFRLRIYLLIIQSTDRVQLFKEYRSRIISEQIPENQLSTTEKIISKVSKIKPSLLSYCLLSLFRYLKKQKYKFKNR